MPPILPPAPAAALPMFTSCDLATIAAWIMTRPLGLRGDIAGDHDEFGDVFEVTRGDPNAPLYFVAPRPSGGIEVSPGDARRDAFRAGAGGTDQVETATVADITAALAMVERVELRALGGGW